MGRGKKEEETLMSDELLTLLNVIRQANSMNASSFLYLPFDERWCRSTRCAVLPTSDIDGNPEFASKHSLECAIQVSFVQDVVANLIQQIREPEDSQLVDALLYYYDNDAFFVSSQCDDAG